MKTKLFEHVDGNQFKLRKESLLNEGVTVRLTQDLENHPSKLYFPHQYDDSGKEFKKYKKGETFSGGKMIDGNNVVWPAGHGLSAEFPEGSYEILKTIKDREPSTKMSSMEKEKRERDNRIARNSSFSTTQPGSPD